MFNITMRLGFGFDIESSDSTCYIIESEDEEGNTEAYVAAFEGLMVTIPFFKILFGTFHELDLDMFEN
jgi:hypothetical protein